MSVSVPACCINASHAGNILFAEICCTIRGASGRNFVRKRWPQSHLNDKRLDHFKLFCMQTTFVFCNNERSPDINYERLYATPQCGLRHCGVPLPLQSCWSTSFLLLGFQCACGRVAKTNLHTLCVHTGTRTIRISQTMISIRCCRHRHKRYTWPPSCHRNPLIQVQCSVCKNAVGWGVSVYQHVGSSNVERLPPR